MPLFFKRTLIIFFKVSLSVQNNNKNSDIFNYYGHKSKRKQTGKKKRLVCPQKGYHPISMIQFVPKMQNYIT